MAAKLTRMTHKIAIQLHLVADSCTICSSRSRWPVRKLLDTPSYVAHMLKNTATSLIRRRRTSNHHLSALVVGLRGGGGVIFKLLTWVLFKQIKIWFTSNSYVIQRNWQPAPVQSMSVNITSAGVSLLHVTAISLLFTMRFLQKRKKGTGKESVKDSSFLSVRPYNKSPKLLYRFLLNLVLCVHTMITEESRFLPSSGGFWYRTSIKTDCDCSLQQSSQFEIIDHRTIGGCNQKFPDWVDNEIHAYSNKHSLRSNTKGYDGKTH
jgi:hypothetical protein